MVLEEGDIINIPTGIFRGFENIGTDYGMIMAILGGDDAGGGVIWAPEVIQDATEHGPVLGENGRLYDTKKGERLPDGVRPMPVLTEEEALGLPGASPRAISARLRGPLLGSDGACREGACQGDRPDALLKDRPGFDVEFLTRGSIAEEPYVTDRHEVVMVFRGHWRPCGRGDGPRSR